LNNPKDLDLIISQIENEGCYKNPGPAAEAAVKWLDEEFVLIPRETLPVIKHPSLDDALGGDTTARLTNIGEQAFGGDHKKMRDLALQYLVMADFIENKAAKEAETKLKAAQFDAYKILFPRTTATVDDFDINDKMISVSTRNGIAAIMELKAQLAKQAGKQ
jgi:hypothetical protein